jgi:hypothetical protein
MDDGWRRGGILARISTVALSLALVLAACGGGTLTLSEYGEQGEQLVIEVSQRVDALDAELESEDQTVDSVRAYWDERVEARRDFSEGLAALEPPEEAAELHAIVVDIFNRLTAAEESLAARVTSLETVSGPAEWWATPEGQAARAVDEEVTQICVVAQGAFDETVDREAVVDVPWMPPEMKEVVRVAFGCPD